jgi:hypothetical protein
MKDGAIFKASHMYVSQDIHKTREWGGRGLKSTPSPPPRVYNFFEQKIQDFGDFCEISSIKWQIFTLILGTPEICTN